ncbi:unnamed protein product [Adineta steineri]|uniref:Multifunctional fusion protein n=1 Tax=Adineta steineri TaxID=433720 RepID=A0A815BWV7_9BILA|nr:unnamed protein product [Adineta steineri]CAF1275274.1 unnamed protein product [Adineta steineri]
MNNNNTTTASSDAIQQRRRMVPNYSLLYLDECTGEANQEYQDILTQLKTITGNVNIFKQRDECIDFLTDTQENIKSFLVLESTIAQQMIPLIHDIPELNAVYIFNSIKSLHEEWTSNWQKIKSVRTNIKDLCQALQPNVKRRNQDSIALSFVTANEIASTDNLNQLEPAFMYTQIFKEIILDMDHSKRAIKQFIAYCRHNDCVSLTNIDRFEKEYNAQSAIWWYTFPCNIYDMINYALRILDADIIINMGFFLRDVHKQIQQLYEQQVSIYGRETFMVYRGQGLMQSDFEKLQKTKGGLMSFSNFVSTSTNKEVSLGFAQPASIEPNKVGILFIMSIDPSIKSAPFASIKEMSYYKDEDEVLFSMNTVFRVGAIKQIDNINQLYQVELQLTSDDDQQLRLLTDRMREEADGNTGWERLGKLLITVGQFNKAEEIYNVLLKQTSDEGEKAFYYNQLGGVHLNQRDYEKAIWYNEKGLEICKKTLPSNHPSLATSYNNIGLAYHCMGEYPKALSSHAKAHEMYKKTLPSNHPSLAQSYNNIAAVYDSMKEYSNALSLHEKAVEIRQKSLPSNHPDLAASYNNIGGVYDNMGEYTKALSFYEKDLGIKEKTLPSNHPHLATSYNNIGFVYNNMKNYSKALSYYERALKIWQRALPPSHPRIKNMKEYIEIVKKNYKE